MQFDGFAVEKWRAQFTGAIDIEEAEGLAMRTDKVVVMVVATRIRKSIPEPLDEDGTMRITRQNKIEHLVVLEGDMREQALSLLASGSERGFQQSIVDLIDQAPAGVDADGVVAETGMSPYAQPAGAIQEQLDAIAQPNEQAGEPDQDLAVHTPPTPAVVLEVPPEEAEPTERLEERDARPPRDEPEYFDVPPIEDTSQPVGTGPIKTPGRGGGGNSGGDGPKIAAVDYSDLAAVGASPGGGLADPAAPPVGEVVGVARAPRKDKALEDFFNEEIQ